MQLMDNSSGKTSSYETQVYTGQSYIQDIILNGYPDVEQRYVSSVQAYEFVV